MGLSLPGSESLKRQWKSINTVWKRQKDEKETDTKRESIFPLNLLSTSVAFLSFPLILDFFQSLNCIFIYFRQVFIVAPATAGGSKNK